MRVTWRLCIALHLHGAVPGRERKLAQDEVQMGKHLVNFSVIFFQLKHTSKFVFLTMGMGQLIIFFEARYGKHENQTETHKP